MPEDHRENQSTPAAFTACARHAVNAMGTRFECVLYGENAARLAWLAEAALDEVLQWHQRVSRFERHSILSRVNAQAWSRPVRVDSDTFELLAACREARTATAGAFDPAVGGAMEQLGFHPAAERSPGAAATFEDVLLDPEQHSVRFMRECVRLDLGAIAKGHALDAAAAVLAQHGISRALLHGGTSSVVAIGAPPDAPGWRIKLTEDPRSPVIELKDAALSVSAPAGRQINTPDGPRSHILDPRTGRPAEGASLAAAISASARTAEVWSTALIVLAGDPERGQRVQRPEDLTTIVHAADRWTVRGPHSRLVRLPAVTEPTHAGS